MFSVFSSLLTEDLIALFQQWAHTRSCAAQRHVIVHQTSLFLDSFNTSFQASKLSVLCLSDHDSCTEISTRSDATRGDSECECTSLCLCVSVCVRLFSGLSHRSWRCLADFYADGLKNGWEMLVLHRGSHLHQHTTWHIHALTSTHTHTHTNMGTEWKPQPLPFNLTSQRWKATCYTAELRWRRNSSSLNQDGGVKQRWFVFLELMQVFHIISCI